MHSSALRALPLTLNPTTLTLRSTPLSRRSLATSHGSFAGGFAVGEEQYGALADGHDVLGVGAGSLVFGRKHLGAEDTHAHFGIVGEFSGDLFECLLRGIDLRSAATDRLLHRSRRVEDQHEPAIDLGFVWVRLPCRDALGVADSGRW